MSKLNLAEDIILLLLDDDTGKMEDVHANVTEMLMAGAVLMDLGLKGRIDCDLERLFVVDATPTGDAILDETLRQIETEAESLPPKTWIQRIAEQGMQIRDAAIASLERRNIIKVQDTRFLWVFGSRRYPVIDDREEREAKLRLMDVLLSDKIPDPPRRGAHLPGGLRFRVRGDPQRARAAPRRRAHRAGAQARPHRPSDVRPDPQVRL